MNRDKLVAQLKRDEGTVLHAYQDHLGYWTIGTGRLIDIRGGGITPEEAEYLLSNDIDTRFAQLSKRIPWFDTLSSARQGVLMNMAFQLGIGGLLAFKNTLRLVEVGDYTGASREMLNSAWAKQTPERAKRLSEQMRTNEWN